MSNRECYSCGSRPGDTRFPAERVRGMPVLCLDCLLEWASEVTRPERCAATLRDIQEHRGIVTRAMYRARLRVRQTRPQGDLIDMCVPSP